MLDSPHSILPCLIESHPIVRSLYFVPHIYNLYRIVFILTFLLLKGVDCTKWGAEHNKSVNDHVQVTYMCKEIQGSQLESSVQQLQPTDSVGNNQIGWKKYKEAEAGMESRITLTHCYSRNNQIWSMMWKLVLVFMGAVNMMVKEFRVRLGWRAAVIKLQNAYTPCHALRSRFYKEWFEWYEECLANLTYVEYSELFNQKFMLKP